MGTTHNNRNPSSNAEPLACSFAKGKPWLSCAKRDVNGTTTQQFATTYDCKHMTAAILPACQTGWKHEIHVSIRFAGLFLRVVHELFFCICARPHLPPPSPPLMRILHALEAMVEACMSLHVYIHNWQDTSCTQPGGHRPFRPLWPMAVACTCTSPAWW